MREERSGHDQRFLIREQHALAGARGGQCRGKAGGADNRRHDHLAARVERDVFERLGAEEKLGAKFTERRAQPGARRDAREHGGVRVVRAAELEQRIARAVRGERRDTVPIGVPRDNIERALTDRTGGAQNCEIHPLTLIHGNNNAASGSVAVALSMRSRMPP